MFVASRAPSLKTVLIATGVVLTLAMGVRHGFGFWMQPISQANGWTRETYSLAQALQNLMWGAFGPFAGMAADRFGTMRVVLVGALSYAAGLVWMAVVTDPTMFVIGTGVLIGLGLSCTAFGAVSGIIGRVAPAEKRSWAFGISGAASSFGQFLMMPVEQQLISAIGWQNAFYVLAALVLLLMIPMTFYLREPAADHGDGPQQSIREAMSEAVRNRSFLFLVAGYFVCGFQVVFIGVHLPAYLVDQHLPATVGTTVLALIGLFNIFGTYTAGWLGGRMSKPRLLTGLYLLRAVVITLFLWAPVSTTTAYLFGMAMGFLWLSTVPLTNGTVATLFGVRNLSMLGGIVFLFHQLGAFLGGWLGGVVYDRTGSYDLIWQMAILLSLLAAALNWPVRERPVARLQAQVGAI